MSKVTRAPQQSPQQAPQQSPQQAPQSKYSPQQTADIINVRNNIAARHSSAPKGQEWSVIAYRLIDDPKRGYIKGAMLLIGTAPSEEEAEELGNSYIKQEKTAFSHPLILRTGYVVPLFTDYNMHMLVDKKIKSDVNDIMTTIARQEVMEMQREMVEFKKAEKKIMNEVIPEDNPENPAFLAKIHVKLSFYERQIIKAYETLNAVLPLWHRVSNERKAHENAHPEHLKEWREWYTNFLESGGSRDHLPLASRVVPVAIEMPNLVSEDDGKSLMEIFKENKVADDEKNEEEDEDDEVIQL